MTKNQIDYGVYLEGVRHNKATEVENQRHNIAGENETYRHNVEGERQGILALNETSRHNRATEANQIYTAQIAANASMYNARLNYQASKYATDRNEAVKRQELDDRILMKDLDIIAAGERQNSINETNLKITEMKEYGENSRSFWSLGINSLLGIAKIW